MNPPNPQPFAYPAPEQMRQTMHCRDCFGLPSRESLILERVKEIEYRRAVESEIKPAFRVNTEDFRKQLRITHDALMASWRRRRAADDINDTADSQWADWQEDVHGLNSQPKARSRMAIAGALMALALVFVALWWVCGGNHAREALAGILGGLLAGAAFAGRGEE